MRIPSFKISKKRNIDLAECLAVPPVMIITGPNGCGKSTLLQELREVSGEGRPMYIGPHRSSRRQRVQFQYLGPRLSMRDVLEGKSLPSYQGIDHIHNARNPWDRDDAPSFLKYGLCQIELDRRDAIAEAYDKTGEIKKDSLPDIWAPLRDMASTLLPHLVFDKIDTANKSSINCLWRVHNSSESVDIDDLSSGEKSVIQLFYPLIEHRLREALANLKGGALPEAKAPCLLMDEPELHLHPNLQGQILEYIRTLATAEGTQFVLVTHSPAIVERANSQELFLLRPAELAKGENQLVRIADDEARLEVLKDVFGQVSNVTAMRPILVVEGSHADLSNKKPANSRLYSFISAEFNSLTIIPAGGKSECQSLTAALNKVLKQFSPQLEAHALLDRDVDEKEPSDPAQHLLPVSMVENLMLDPLVLWEALVVIRHKTSLADPAAVEAALGTILDEMRELEIARRIKAQIGARTFRVIDPVAEIEKQVETFTSALQSQLSVDRINALRVEAERAVAEIVKVSKRREFFHGKKVLEEFYKRHVHQTGMSKEIFVYECARRAGERKTVKRFVSTFLKSVGLKPDVKK